MFIRIVKMSFEVSKIETFLQNFNNNKEKIRNSKGCRLLELYRDKTKPTVFFTFSYWECEQDLENYRTSELFKSVWSKTKKLFHEKPEAWSLDKLDSVEKLENEIHNP